ncbi:HNH endonuclease [Aeromonas salmonicida]|uniref:HNH endonuclease n=1 Tax=Aeromonas piscicola TaxID=600645 RepID=UPI0012E05BAF|nr:HNH endonuclease [Aeromonas piscicola]
MALQKKCLHPTCTSIALDGETKCEKHFVPRKKVSNYSSDKFYNTSRWKILSNKYLSKNPICEICNKRPSEQVDHWLERRMLLGLSYQTNPDNLISECTSCHSTKSAVVRKLGLNSYGTIKYLIENYPRDSGIDYLLDYQIKRETDSFRKEKE